MAFCHQVRDTPEDSSSSVDDLNNAVKNAEDQLKEEGLLSGSTMAQIVTSVSEKLNGQSDESTKAERQEVIGTHRP